MKKTINKTVLLVIISIAAFMSCKKESDNSNVKLLTREEWRLSKDEEKINSDPYIDYIPSLPPCDQDDKYSFRTDNSYEVNEGATKCDPINPQVIRTGTWQFSQNGAKINIDGSESTINQLDENTFILSGSYITNPDTNYYRYTFVH